MPVRVRLFAILRDETGHDELELDLAPGASGEDVLRKLEAMFPQLGALWARSLLAVNERLASPQQELSAGDFVAVLPPVSGG